MMVKKVKSVKWNFPKNRFLKLEAYTLGLVAIIVFLFSFLKFNDAIMAIEVTIIFILLYVLIMYLVQFIRRVEEKYHLTSTHLDIHHHSRFAESHDQIPLKHIKRHKLDKFFLGGYVLTKKGKKHLLYFNNRKEAEKFEQTLKSHLRLK